jgi:hypothetical protein
MSKQQDSSSQNHQPKRYDKSVPVQLQGFCSRLHAERRNAIGVIHGAAVKGTKQNSTEKGNQRRCRDCRRDVEPPLHSRARPPNQCNFRYCDEQRSQLLPHHMESRMTKPQRVRRMRSVQVSRQRGNAPATRKDRKCKPGKKHPGHLRIVLWHEQTTSRNQHRPPF